MRTVMITETDPSFVSGLKAMLIDMGALETNQPNIIKVPPHINIDAFHGLADQDSIPAAVRTWLENYDGDFGFYLSLKSQMQSKGTLSQKQIESVFKAIGREKKPEIAREFSIKPGQLVLLTRGWARKLASKAGHIRPHFIFEVVEVLNETEKAYQLKLKMSAQRTSCCSICGLALTDPQSVVAGIGPICAERLGLPHGDASLSQLEMVLNQMAVVETWMPKMAIKKKF